MTLNSELFQHKIRRQMLFMRIVHKFREDNNKFAF